MQKLLSHIRAALEKYDMIAEGDKICVCVSGGKDSVILLCALKELKRFYPKNFELAAVTVDPMFFGRESDYSPIEKICRENGIEYLIKRTDLYNVIFETRRETNPCSLCARMRRGILHDCAKELGCNKIALGHHGDDAAETFIMNLFSGGRAECFSPVSYLSRKDLYMIRPLIFCDEQEIERVIRKEGLPVVKSACPADENTAREDTKRLIADLEKTYPALRQKLIGAMERGKISGWHE